MVFENTITIECFFAFWQCIAIINYDNDDGSLRIEGSENTNLGSLLRSQNGIVIMNSATETIGDGSFEQKHGIFNNSTQGVFAQSTILVSRHRRSGAFWLGEQQQQRKNWDNSLGCIEASSSSSSSSRVCIRLRLESSRLRRQWIILHHFLPRRLGLRWSERGAEECGDKMRPG